MNPLQKNIDLAEKVFAASEKNFNQLALEIFRFQYTGNPVYRQYCNALKVEARTIDHIEKIPFLPISFFKTHTVTTTAFTAEALFESSGTTGSQTSRHFVKYTALYKKSFTTAFEHFYGSAANWCILGLLPAYLERNNSSLVTMVDELIKQSNHLLSGFYLTDFEKLHSTILHNELQKQPTLLIGVTYALLDFAQKFPMQLRYTTIMETGGMKGRRKELTREEVHKKLQTQLGVSIVHSEYGMTELLSQAYSKGNGFFHSPQWMKILIRDEDDPLHVTTPEMLYQKPVTGAVNIIDLANLYSCSFIATDDAGKLYSDNTFEILGRIDNSDLRGCSLLAL